MKRKSYRAKEISKMHGIGMSTVWKYAKDGKLTPIKISTRLTVFKAEEVEALFDNNSSTAS